MPRANPDVNYEISIHALLAESDPFTTSMSTRLVGFLSTLSLRRATTQHQKAGGVLDHFYPRSPCGERRFWRTCLPPCGNFYPRSPCGERRWSLNQSLTSGLFLSTLSLRRATVFILYPDSAPTFLSTLSLRRATFLPLHTRQRTQISIHALLAESDKIRQTPQRPAHHFYPRSPCGERHTEIDLNGVADLFLSTLSLRRATRGIVGGCRLFDISIHALLAESDLPCHAAHTRPAVFLSTLYLRRATCRATPRTLGPQYFYPRSPCGERLAQGVVLPQHRNFYPRSPCGERHTSAQSWKDAYHFYPRSPCGERPAPTRARRPATAFLSTLSLRRATAPTTSIFARPGFLSTLSLRRATVLSTAI